MEIFFVLLIISIQSFGQSIERGKYIARAADCVSCHTNKKEEEYAGGLKIETAFGTFFTPNITPDKDTGIGNWTFDDFYKALHEGVGINGEHLYPAFPYVFFTKIPKQDVEDLYEYLKTVKPIYKPSQPQALSFPFSQRGLLSFWKLLYFNEGEFQPDSSRSEEWNRGAYLVNGPAHCGSCHTPRTALGGMKESEAFSGSNIEGWHASNITSNIALGIGSWSLEDVFDFLKKGYVNERTSAIGPMREVINNSLSYLTDEDIRAMAVFLKSLPPQDEVENFYFENQERAKTLFLENCGGCHHPTGMGRKDRIPPLANNTMFQSDGPANMIKVILIGIPPTKNFPEMPSFSNLSNEDISLILNYVRTLWGNTNLQPVSPDDVQKQR